MAGYAEAHRRSLVSASLGAGASGVGAGPSLPSRTPAGRARRPSARAAPAEAPAPRPPPPPPVTPPSRIREGAPDAAAEAVASTTARPQTQRRASVALQPRTARPPSRDLRRASMPAAVAIPTTTAAAANRQRPAKAHVLPLSALLRTNPQLFTPSKIHAAERGVTAVDALPERYKGAKTVLLSGNRLASLAPLAQFPNLETLSAAHNNVEHVAGLHELAAACPNLTRLMLEGNPVARVPTYRARVLLLLPHLKHLDARAVTDAERAAAAPAVRREADTLALMASNTCTARKLTRVRLLVCIGKDLLAFNFARDAPLRRHERAAGVARRPPDVGMLLRLWDYEGGLDDDDRRQIDAENIRLIRRVAVDASGGARLPDPSDPVPKTAEAWGGVYAKAMNKQQERIQGLLTEVEEARAEFEGLLASHISRDPGGAVAEAAEAEARAETERRDEREALIAELRDDLDDVRFAYLAGGPTVQSPAGLLTAGTAKASPTPVPRALQFDPATAQPRARSSPAHAPSRASVPHASPVPQPAPPPPPPVTSHRPRAASSVPAPARYEPGGDVPTLDQALFGTPLHLESPDLATAVRVAETGRRRSASIAASGLRSPARPPHAAAATSAFVRVQALESELDAACTETEALRRAQGVAARALSTIAQAGKRELAVRALARQSLLRRCFLRLLKSMPRLQARRARVAIADAHQARRAERRRAACFTEWRESRVPYPPELEEAGTLAAGLYRRGVLQRRGFEALRRAARLDDVPLGAATAAAEVHARQAKARAALHGLSSAPRLSRAANASHARADGFARRRNHRHQRRTFEAWRRIGCTEALRRRLEALELQLAVRRPSGASAQAVPAVAAAPAAGAALAASAGAAAPKREYRFTAMSLDELLGDEPPLRSHPHRSNAQATAPAPLEPGVVPRSPTSGAPTAHAAIAEDGQRDVAATQAVVETAAAMVEADAVALVSAPPAIPADDELVESVTALQDRISAILREPPPPTPPRGRAAGV